MDQTQSIPLERVMIDIHPAIDLTLIGRAVKIDFAHGGKPRTCPAQNHCQLNGYVCLKPDTWPKSGCELRGWSVPLSTPTKVRVGTDTISPAEPGGRA